MEVFSLSLKPFSDQAKKVFDRIIKDGYAEIEDIHFTRSWGRHYPELDSDDWLWLTRRGKKQKTVIIKPKNVVMYPKFTNGHGLKIHFERLHL